MIELFGFPHRIVPFFYCGIPYHCLIKFSGGSQNYSNNWLNLPTLRWQFYHVMHLLMLSHWGRGGGGGEAGHRRGI